MSRILLVESDAAEREAFVRAVGAEHPVIAVGVLDQADAKLADADLIVLGLETSNGMDLTVLDRVRALRPGLPIIITAPATLHGWQLLRSGMRLGAWDFLTKPFDGDEVRQTILRASGSETRETSSLAM